MKSRKFLTFRNIFFIIIALSLVGGFSAAGFRAATSDSTEKPTDIRVTNLVISPNPAQVGERVTISAYVANPGNSDGTYTPTLKINDQEVEVEGGTAEVRVPAGKTIPVELFALTPRVAGTYKIEVDGVSRTLEVIEPFQVTNLVISPPQIQIGEQATFTAEVTNTGELDGTHTIILKINGEEAEGGTAEVPVPAGETRPVEFTFTPPAAGTYEIEVDGLSDTLEVTAP